MKFLVIRFVLVLLFLYTSVGFAIHERKKEKAKYQFSTSLWIAHIPSVRVLPLVNHAPLSVKLNTRPGAYGQEVNFERTVEIDGRETGEGRVNTKNTYGISSPHLEWHHKLTKEVEKEVTTGCCCFSCPGPVTVVAPYVEQQQVTINVEEVLKTPASTCMRDMRSKGRHILREFPEHLNSTPFVSHLVHYDFKRGHIAGNAGIYPMMKQVILGESFTDIHPKRETYPIEHPGQSIHLFHLIQQEMPLRMVQADVVTTTEQEEDWEDGKKWKVNEEEKREANNDEKGEMQRLLKEDRRDYREALSEGSTPSCMRGFPSGRGTLPGCYQDDLLGTDCTTTILKVSVLRPTGENAMGIVIVPGHDSGDDAIILFAGSDHDAPPPDDGPAPGVVIIPSGVSPGPRSPGLFDIHHSIWSVAGISMMMDDEQELQRNGPYRRSYDRARIINYFARPPSITRSFRRDAAWQ